MFQDTNITPYKLFNYIMIVYLISALHKLIDSIIFSISSLDGFGITDFFINYQGGYVRRGLLGEILYQYSLIANQTPILLIIIISLLSFIIVCIFFTYQFKKNQIYWWILPLSFTLLGGEIIRKDYLCMIFVILILYTLKSNFNKFIKVFFIYILSILLWNLHEAFFFVIGPFMIGNIINDTKISKYISIRIITIIPILFFFLYTCYYKGNIQIAQSIQSSWHILFPNDFTNEIKFNSIGAIGWNTIDTIKFHIQRNFGFESNISGLLVRPISFILVYYVVSRYFFIFVGNNIPWKYKENSLFSTLLIFQFLSLSPLFLLFSCDYSRIFMYWTISTLSIFLIFGTEEKYYFLPQKTIYWIRNINNGIDRFLNWISIPQKQFICLIILFLGISPFNFSFDRAISNSVIGTILTEISKLILYLKNLIL